MFYIQPVFSYFIVHHLDVQYTMHRPFQTQGITEADDDHLPSQNVFKASIFPGLYFRNQRTTRKHPQKQQFRFGATTLQGSTGGQMYILRMFSSEVKTLLFSFCLQSRLSNYQFCLFVREDSALCSQVGLKQPLLISVIHL